MILNTNNIFQTGYLSNLANTVFLDDDREKLKNTDLTRIATILGTISRGCDLYNELFVLPDHVLNVDNIDVHSKDLASFVYMDHMFTRGNFAIQAGGKATSDTTNCQGVPLAFEGAKRLYNKKYSSWITTLDTKERDKIFRYDVFLPAGLGSYTISEDVVVPLDTYGLVSLLANEITFPDEVLTEFKKSYARWKIAPTPKIMSGDTKYTRIYNRCEHKLRALILQGWIWQPACRNADMITNISNWDTFSPEHTIKPQSLPGMVSSDLKFTGFPPIKLFGDDLKL